MKKNKIIISFILLLLAIIIILFPFNMLWEILIKFNSDGEIKHKTYLNINDTFNKVKILILFMFCLTISLLLYKKKLIKGLSYFIFFIIKQFGLLSKATFRQIFYFSSFFILLFLIWTPFSLDIGADESVYLNIVQNINEYGRATAINGTNNVIYNEIPNFILSIIGDFTVPIFGFSVLFFRFVIVLFSIGLFFVILNLFGKETSCIIIPLIFLFPGIYMIMSTVFLEIPSIFFVFLGLLFLKKYENTKKNVFPYISSFSISLALITKLIFIPFLSLTVLILIIYLVYKKDIRNTTFIVKYSISVIFFSAIITLITFLTEGEVAKNTIIWLFSEKDQGFKIGNTLYKSFILNGLLFIPLIIYFWKVSWKIIKEKKSNVYFLIYFGAIITTLYWLIFMRTSTWRNLALPIILNLIIAGIYLHKKNNRSVRLVLISYIFINIFMNFALICNGVNDDIQYYRASMLDNFISTFHNNYQKEFFANVKKHIDETDLVYVPLTPYISKVYLENRKIENISSYDISAQSKKYLIVTANDVKEQRLEREIIKNILLASEVVLQKGNYILYELP